MNCNIKLCCAAAAAGLLLSGCLSYERPPLAVDQSSYTALQEKEKKMLPPVIMGYSTDAGRSRAPTS